LKRTNLGEPFLSSVIITTNEFKSSGRGGRVRDREAGKEGGSGMRTMADGGRAGGRGEGRENRTRQSSS